MNCVRFFVGVIFLSVLVAGANLPGLNTGIGRGYDLIYTASRAPIVKWNYNEGNDWTFPLTQTTYKSPDEVWATNQPESTFSSDNVIVRNFSEYVETKSKWFHLGVGIPGVFSFGMDKESKTVKAILSGGNSTVFVVTRLFHLFGIATWPYETLENQQSTPFQVAVSKLPATYNKDAYEAFIKLFGTHFVTQSGFGGYYSYILSVDNKLYRNYTESWVRKQVSFSVTYNDITFGFNWGSDITKKNISEEFTTHSRTHTFWHGGTQEGFSKNFTAWYKSIISNPGLVSPYLVPISHLVEDPKKKATLDAAVVKYLNTRPKDL